MARISFADATEQDLREALALARANIARAQSTIDGLQPQIRNIQENLQFLQRQLQSNPSDVGVIRANIDLQQSRLNRTLAQLEAANVEIRNMQELERDVNQALANRAGGTASAGLIIQDSAQARAQGSNTQVPEPPGQQIDQTGTVGTTPATTQPTNAEPALPVVPTGVAAPLPAGAVVGTAANTIVPSNQSATSASAVGGGGAGGALPGAPQTQPASVDSLQNGPTLQPTQSYIYKAITVTSIFEKGRFTQELEGRLLIFPFESANGAPLPNSETQRESASTTRTAATDAVVAGTMRPAPRTLQVNQPGASIPAAVTTAGSTSVFVPGQRQPTTSQGQPVGVFDFATVGQGVPASTGAPAGNVGFDYATVGQTGVASNQQLNRET